MNELVSVLYGELIVELLLVLGVDQHVVHLSLAPLLSGREVLDSREHEGLGCQPLCRVLVVSQIELEVQLCLIGKALSVRPLLKQVLGYG